jgi:hypothetical protein
VQAWEINKSYARPKWEEWLVPAGTSQAMIQETLREKLGAFIQNGEPRIAIAPGYRIRCIAAYPVRAVGEPLDLQIPLEFTVEAVNLD